MRFRPQKNTKKNNDIMISSESVFPFQAQCNIDLEML